MNKGLIALRDELGRTGTISDNFKRLIMAWAQAAVKEAYELGKKHGKETKENV